VNSAAVTEKIVCVVRALPVEFGGEAHKGWLPDGASTPTVTPRIQMLLDLRVIELAPGSYLLHWRPARGQHLEGPPYEGDTWHACVEDALEQAQLMFDVTPDRWQPTDVQ